MALCCGKRYRALILILGMIVIAAVGTGEALAEPSADVVVSPVGTSITPAQERTPSISADASGPDKGNRWSFWPAPVAEPMARPTLEMDDISVATGLTSGAIIRPMKDKKFALALVAGTPTPGKSSTLGAGKYVFKHAHSSFLTPSRNETIQWVVLTDMMPTGRQGGVRETIELGSDEAANDEASWHYAVEMIFVPMTSLAVRAALTVTPGEEEFDTSELTQALERSRIGVSIGLDFRPRDGVVLDFDYARVMNGLDIMQNPWMAAIADPESTEGSTAGDDVISVSLSIQF